jgi:hypothetical protein
MQIIRLIFMPTSSHRITLGLYSSVRIDRLIFIRCGQFGLSVVSGMMAGGFCGYRSMSRS